MCIILGMYISTHSRSQNYLEDITRSPTIISVEIAFLFTFSASTNNVKLRLVNNIEQAFCTE